MRGTWLPRDQLSVAGEHRIDPDLLISYGFAKLGKVTLGPFYSIRIGNSRMKSKIGLKIPRHV